MSTIDRFAAVVTAYNEEHGIGHVLGYLNELAERAPVVLVDDGSTDRTAEIMREFQPNVNSNFHLRYEPVNRRKVGSVGNAVFNLDEITGRRIDYVGLLDADCRIRNPERLGATLEAFETDQRLGGMALRIEPANDNSFTAAMQRYVVYPVDRAIHRFTSESGQVRCAPGAGSIYRRGPLEVALMEHSGRHSSDDFEITTSVQRHGWNIRYCPDLVVEAVVPDTLAGYMKQQARWRLGGLQTIAKEGNFFYRKNIRSRLGAVMAAEAAMWTTIPATLAFMAKCAVDGDAASFATTAATNSAIATAIAGGILAYNRGELEAPWETIKRFPALPLYSWVFFASSIKAAGDFIGSRFGRAEKAESASAGTRFSFSTPSATQGDN